MSVMTDDELDRAGVEKYLDLATKNVIEEHRTSGPADICARLVEKINSELPDKCSSVESYKYIVHATVQVNIRPGLTLTRSRVTNMCKACLDCVAQFPPRTRIVCFRIYLLLPTNN